MTVISVTLRRPPPCWKCGRTGQVPYEFGDAGAMAICGACKGRAGEVEYGFIYGPRKRTKGLWLPWPGLGRATRTSAR